MKPEQINLIKRSISPVIATILLIVVSVILITVVLTWGSGFAKDNLNSINTLDQITEMDFSSFVNIDSYMQLENKNVIILKNSHNTLDFEVIGYKILTNKDFPFTDQIFYFPNSYYFKPGQFNSLDIICFPENEFKLQLITKDNEYITLPIKIKNFNENAYCFGKELIVWLKADHLNLNDGDQVDFWQDLSFNNNHAYKVTDQNRPEYRENQINGHPALYFDGFDRLSLNKDLYDNFNKLSVYVVFSYEQLKMFSPLLFYNSGSWPDNYQNIKLYSTTSRISSTLANGVTYNNVASQTNIVTGEWYYVNQNWNGQVHQIYLNGSLENENNFSISIPEDNAIGYHIGARAKYNHPDYKNLYGYIAEILIFNRDLSSSEREFINFYIYNKYLID